MTTLERAIAESDARHAEAERNTWAQYPYLIILNGLPCAGLHEIKPARKHHTHCVARFSTIKTNVNRCDLVSADGEVLAEWQKS